MLSRSYIYVRIPAYRACATHTRVFIRLSPRAIRARVRTHADRKEREKEREEEEERKTKIETGGIVVSR